MFIECRCGATYNIHMPAASAADIVYLLIDKNNKEVLEIYSHLPLALEAAEQYPNVEVIERELCY